VRLVYLYGPPGVGKLTVARELVALTGFKLFHNHLTVNLVSSVFPFNSEPYIRLMRQFRRDMLAEAARADVDLVFTGVYVGTSEQFDAIQRIVEPIYAGGGTVLFVQLTCERDVWLARVSNESRRADVKLTDPDRAIALFQGRDPFSAMPVEPSLRIDTTQLPPTEAAALIAAHYALPLVEAGQRQVP
jgi:shikimate kinase